MMYADNVLINFSVNFLWMWGGSLHIQNLSLFLYPPMKYSKEYECSVMVIFVQTVLFMEIIILLTYLRNHSHIYDYVMKGFDHLWNIKSIKSNKAR